MKKAFFTFATIVLGISLFLWLRQVYTPRPEIPKIIIVATSADFPPMSFRDNGKIVGFDIDVVTEALKRLGKTMRLEELPFELLLPQLQTGTIHVVAAGLTITPERSRRVYFSPTYLSGDHLAVLTPSQKPPMDNLDALKNKTVIVNSGYNSEVYMSKFPNISLLRTPTIETALAMLNLGKADAFVTAANTIGPIFDKHGRDKFNLFVIEDTDENSALAISKQYPKLAKALHTIIEEMKTDGTIEKLKNKWSVQ